MTVVAWCGDSITEGAGASAVGKRWPNQVHKLLGARVSQGWINAGVGGDTSAGLLARIDDILGTGPELLVVMIGTNDAGHDIPLAAYQDNIEAIREAAAVVGVPLVLCTVPPRSTAPLVPTYNLWLRQWCHHNGIPCVDTYRPLVDPATGLLAAAYDSGDGVHPSDAGHLAIATAVAGVLDGVLQLPTWPVGGGIVSGGWTHTAGPTASLSTVDGYQRITLASGLATYSLPIGAEGVAWDEGDELLVALQLRGSSPAAINKIQLQDGSTPVGAIVESGFPTANPGPLLRTVTIPAVGGTLRLGVNIDARTAPAWVDVIADVWNLTKRGLTDLEV